MRISHEVMGIDLDRRQPRGARSRATSAPSRWGSTCSTSAPAPTRSGRRSPASTPTGSVACRRSRTAPTSWTAARPGPLPHVVVVGGGYIGLEMAEAFLQRGAKVVLVEGERSTDAHARPRHGGQLADAVRRHGIDLRLGAKVIGFDRRAVHTDTGTFPADLSSSGSASRPTPRSPATRASSSAAARRSQVDRRQRTSAEGVWAAGDCADSFHLVSQRRIHIALGTVANKQGRVAGIEHRWRLRHVPRSGRHRHHQGVRHRGRPAPVSPSTKPADAGFEYVVGIGRQHHAGRVLPRRRSR